MGLLKQLKSKETWMKVLYFSTLFRPKDEKREITADDILPLILTLIIAICLFILIGILVVKVPQFFKNLAAR